MLLRRIRPLPVRLHVHLLYRPSGGIVYILERFIPRKYLRCGAGYRGYGRHAGGGGTGGEVFGKNAALAVRFFAERRVDREVEARIGEFFVGYGFGCYCFKRIDSVIAYAVGELLFLPSGDVRMQDIFEGFAQDPRGRAHDRQALMRRYRSIAREDTAPVRTAAPQFF